MVQNFEQLDCIVKPYYIAHIKFNLDRLIGNWYTMEKTCPGCRAAGSILWQKGHVDVLGSGTWFQHYFNILNRQHLNDQLSLYTSSCIDPFQRLPRPAR